MRIPNFIVFVTQSLPADSDLDSLQLQFEHPANGMAIGITVFSKKNPASGEWDRVGHIEWTSPLTGAVTLDGNEVRIFSSSTLQRMVHTTSPKVDHQRISQSDKQHEHVRLPITDSRIADLIPPAGHADSSIKESNTSGNLAIKSRTTFM